MDLVGFVSFLRQFKADVLLFGLAAWALALLLRRTLLKNAGEKLLALLPFVLGTVLYVAYRLILLGVCDAAAESAVAEGLTCGALATALQAVFARFTEKKQEAGVRAACVQSLLAGHAVLTAEEAEALADAVETDEAAAKALLQTYVGDAAETYYRLLREALSLLG